MRQLEATTRVEDEHDAELMSNLPEPVSLVSEDKTRFSMAEKCGRNAAGKRIFADLVANKPEPKKSRFPVLYLPVLRIHII